MFLKNFYQGLQMRLTDVFGEVIYRSAEATARYGFDGDFSVDVGGLAGSVGLLIAF